MWVVGSLRKREVDVMKQAMHAFKTYHPIVNFIYFVFVIGSAMLFMHPICLCLSFLCAFVYSVMLKGRKAIKTNLIYMLPVLVVAALMNPLFNHEGATILTYFPSGNPLTLESVVYGLAAAVMLVSVIGWFSCYNELMTSDKHLYLFGRVWPVLSLLLSMTLRFVPLFVAQLKTVADAQKCMGQNAAEGNVFQRARRGLRILSAVVTWSFENAIDTADSMKARGYGLSGRTSFSVFTFDKRDAHALAWLAFLGLYVWVGGIRGSLYFRFFPTLGAKSVTPYTVSVLAAYLLLCSYPIILELWEVQKWRALQSKI